ncbi:unnamed protein product, partial [Arctogadus glacialis]
MALLLRVQIKPKLIRKFHLAQTPESVEHLQNELREKFGLEGGFSLQYEDPDFDNALTNLVDIVELPAERAVLHILWDLDTSASDQSETQSNASVAPTTSSLDTVNSSSTLVGHRHLRNTAEWPCPFPIPPFSYDVEFKLRQGNEVYEKTGKGITVTRNMKMCILEKLADAIFALRAYPDKHQIETVSSELVQKHQCLKEPGSGTGYQGWTISLRYKHGNYRSMLRHAGCNEVSVNRKTGREEDGERKVESCWSLKKPKRGEVNYVPDHPENHDDDTLEGERSGMVNEMKKRSKDMTFIRRKMDLTFSLRRKEIVDQQPMVSVIQERWPALFSEEQICAEFYRVTTKELLGTFRSASDEYCTSLLRLYRAKTGAIGSEMEKLLDKLDHQISDIGVHRRNTSLQGLPLFLREVSEKLFRTCL